MIQYQASYWYQMSFGVMASESSRRSRSVSMETGGLPLVSTFALLTIVAGKDCVELTATLNNIVNAYFVWGLC